MHHYFAYNLRIQSEIPLPELPFGPAGADLIITLAPSEELIETKSIHFGETAGSEATFSFPGVARFTMRGGTQLSITPDPRADRSLFSLYVEGMILAAVMYQRGFFVLHASVVRLEGKAIAFMGPIGAGKSTFASAFRARGHNILADDNAAIDLAATVPQVLPAFPNLKIYPDVAAALGYGMSALRPLHISQVKQAQTVAQGFWPTPLPLSCLYVLDREAAPSISSPLSPVLAITELVRHSVPTRWSVAGGGKHLQMCAQLARAIPVVSVRSFTQLTEISGIAEAIEEHALRLAADVPDPSLCLTH